MAAEKTNRRIGRMTRVVRIVAGVLAFLVLLVAAISVGGAIARSRIKAAYPPLGQMVDVGGYKLHIYCQGVGSPTVLLLSGSAVPSPYWWLVQTEVARTTRVCAYDRAGYAWSDDSSRDMSPRGQVSDLALLLSGAGVEPPYVLVGHSYGGYIARLYAQTHPGQVVGLVMVDSTHEQQFLRYPETIQAAVRQALSSLDSPVRKFVAFLASSLQAVLPAKIPEPAYLPPDIARMAFALTKLHPFIPYTVKAEITEIVMGESPPITGLGDIPVIVITRGVPTPQMGLSEEENAEYERVWFQLQQEMLSLSPNSKHIIAERSTHDEIPLKDARLVVEAILEVLRPSQLGD